MGVLCTWWCPTDLYVEAAAKRRAAEEERIQRWAWVDRDEEEHLEEARKLGLQKAKQFFQYVE